MKTLVLSRWSMGKTGRKIAKALDADYATKVSTDMSECPEQYDRLIRWGTTISPWLDAHIDTVLNPVSRIRDIANRRLMFKHLYDHDIDTLDFMEDFILRSDFGQWGSDIELFTDQFAVQMWLADFEVRVHIVHGVSVCMQIKRQKHEPVNIPKRMWYIRNRKKGWHLYHLHNDEAARLGIDKDVLRTVAKHTIETARLDFGVVDFLVRCTAHSFLHKVLEVNTAPGLEDFTIKRYTERFNA